MPGTSCPRPTHSSPPHPPPPPALRAQHLQGDRAQESLEAEEQLMFTGGPPPTWLCSFQGQAHGHSCRHREQSRHTRPAAGHTQEEPHPGLAESSWLCSHCPPRCFLTPPSWARSHLLPRSSGRGGPPAAPPSMLSGPSEECGAAGGAGG